MLGGWRKASQSLLRAHISTTTLRRKESSRWKVMLLRKGNVLGRTRGQGYGRGGDGLIKEFEGKGEKGSEEGGMGRSWEGGGVGGSERRRR